MKLNSRTKKILAFFAVLVIIIYTFSIITNTDLKRDFMKMSVQRVSVVNVSEQEVAATEHPGAMKYILLWTTAATAPFAYIGDGQKGFVDRNCPYTNCYVTDDKNYLNDVTKYDVVAFSASDLIRLTYNALPTRRSSHQKYVFATIESSDYYPVCSNKFDGYFNWTWTFRLDSEVRWGYMVIRDKNNNLVGPNKEMHWMKYEDMDPVSDEFKKQLKSKTNAAAWYVSNCYSKSRREVYVKKLQEELQKYNLTVDIYGQCGTLKCPRSKEAECFNLIKEKYYFYLSFENSFSEDYVTEKLLNAVWNNAVPIVYGSANYSRFIPDGAYLNAREMKPKSLALKMSQLINNPDDYANYFRWKNHYSYHRKMDSVYTDEYCLFCSILNDKRKVQEYSVYQNFRKWWDPPNRC